MASKLCFVMVLLICSNAHKGAKGNATPTVFSSAGGQVSLPCTNQLNPSDCSSTTWLYSDGRQGTIEEVGHGEVRQSSPNRSQRLAVDSGCSLNITNATSEDAGLYTCQQFLKQGGQQQGGNAPVYLAILQVSAFLEATEIKATSDVGLHCLLHTHDNCGRSVQNKGVRLSWVDKRGKELRNNSNRRIKNSSVCNITILEKLSDLNPSKAQRSWTCQLIANGQIRASANYTIPIKALASVSQIPTDHTVTMIVGALFASVLLAMVLILAIWRRRQNSKRGSQGNDESTIYATVSESHPPSVNEQGTEVEHLHYASLNHLNQPSPKHSIKLPRDTVTYSTVMPPPSGESGNNTDSDDHSVLYATVQDTV